MKAGALAALLLLAAPAAPPAAAEAGGTAAGRPAGLAGAPGAQAPDTLASGPFQVIHWPGDERYAARILQIVVGFAPLPALPGDVLGRGGPIRILLPPDVATLDSLTGGRAPEWGAGIATPAEGVIILPPLSAQRASIDELVPILRHEVAHIGLYRYLEPARVPRWFQEGYATWAAGEWDRESAWTLRLAFLLGRAPPLDSLSLDWPRGAARARLAYLLAASAVGYLVDRSGERGLRIFLARWRETGDFDAALRNTYGVTVAQFEEDWRLEVRKRYGWTSLLAYSAVFWLFAALLLLALFALRRRRDRERLAALRAAELPDRPAYWLGEEDPGEEGHGGDARGGSDGPAPR